MQMMQSIGAGRRRGASPPPKSTWAVAASGAMKVFIHYEEPAAESLRQTLKITLPKKWEKGPCSNLMDTFVKNYNAKHPENQLNGSQLRIETEMREFGRRAPRAGGGGAKSGGFEAGAGGPDAMRACKNFGCNKKYCERTNFDGECRHHTKPPVFHETAKYWSCCPHKKAYDWESFMEIKGCAHGKHSDIKPGAGNVALGGSHVRGAAGGAAGPKLKKIEDYNRGAVELKPIEALKHALIAIGCSASDFEAAVAALNKKFDDDEAEVLAELATEFGFGLHNLIGTTNGMAPPPPSS
ncbi:hypothetical protein JL720_1552 [Aureococcus anophagefferens]|nr:hypothetical protein JL720_1552 [Aureococcus anophagefferens]